jgi:prepilin-type N-terminal cleavage/methylation domain-containing protein
MQRGFTLIELIVIVVIVGVLSVVSAVGYSKVSSTVSVSSVKHTMRVAGASQHARFAERGSFTDELSALEGMVPDGFFVTGEAVYDGDIVASEERVDGADAVVFAGRSEQNCVGLIVSDPVSNPEFETLLFDTGSSGSCSPTEVLLHRGDGIW